MAQSIFQMTSTPENMHLQLDELALQLLMLCQNLGAKYLVFVSSRSVKMRELSFAQFTYILFEESVFIFQSIK